MAPAEPGAVDPDGTDVQRDPENGGDAGDGEPRPRAGERFRPPPRRRRGVTVSLKRFLDRPPGSAEDAQEGSGTEA